MTILFFKTPFKKKKNESAKKIVVVGSFSHRQFLSIFIHDKLMKVHLFIPLISYMIDMALDLIGLDLRVTNMIRFKDAYLE